ncbi:HPF/RaiA family ribosome-associated protein [Myxococcota bacterium]
MQIEFRGLSQSESIAEWIQAKAEELLGEFNEIIRGHVVVGRPHRHHHKGQHFHVNVHVTVPGAELIASRNGDVAHENVYLAANDAFRAMRRQLRTSRRRKITSKRSFASDGIDEAA